MDGIHGLVIKDMGKRGGRVVYLPVFFLLRELFLVEEEDDDEEEEVDLLLLLLLLLPPPPPYCNIYTGLLINYTKLKYMILCV